MTFLVGIVMDVVNMDTTSVAAVVVASRYCHVVVTMPTIVHPKPDMITSGETSLPILINYVETNNNIFQILFFYVLGLRVSIVQMVKSRVV